MNTRQIRLLGIVAILVLLVLYYVSNGARNTRESAFYRSTVSVLTYKKGSSGGGGGGGGGVDLDSPEAKLAIENYKKAMRELALQFDPAGEDGARADVYQQRLSSQAAAAAAEPTADVFGGFPAADEEELLAGLPDAIQPAILPPANDADSPAIDAEKSVAGRKKMKDEDKKAAPQKPVGNEKEGVAKLGNVGSPSPDQESNGKGEKSPATDDASKIETELGDILKRAPIVVFSKSYCPYSKKAKHILQDFYTINPPPHVVELDHHEHGAELQGALNQMTGRRTVPNVLINGVSIGGGDDIEALHTDGKLIEKIRSMGGKRISTIAAKEAAPAPNRDHV